MTSVAVVSVALGAALVAAGLWRASGGIFAAPQLQRSNYRGRELPVAAGIIICLAALVMTAIVRLVVTVAELDASREVASLDRVLVLALGFGLLGLADDLLGDTRRRGFRGHVGAALHGDLTTGFVKLAGGVCLGMIVAADTWADTGAGVSAASVGLTGVGLLVSGLVIASAANLGNLFDRAPGRVVKMSILGIVVVAACGLAAPDLVGPLMVVAAGCGLLLPDLRERCMLGDTGSNVLGAAVGLGLVLALGATGEWVALVVLVALNLVSERISFSQVIDRVPFLAWLDRLGSLRR